ncbi:hypothetical protein HPP92_005855 [Vanilla planifolia]|uniref:Uncharacterized protein n=1 Tax=Vanilla planifolia TaxID=51239 RepID=A0A835VBD0_VANPL|nr:hypothetical protein HPP92_005855 [Vanilla planifolia]
MAGAAHSGWDRRKVQARVHRTGTDIAAEEAGIEVEGSARAADSTSAAPGTEGIAVPALGGTAGPASEDTAEPASEGTGEPASEGTEAPALEGTAAGGRWRNHSHCEGTA